MSAEPGFSCPVLRPLQHDDLNAVMDIELSAYPFPWTLGIFSECLRVGYGCHGAFLGSELAAYVIFNWGAGESHLLNLCVREGEQRQGLGRLLLEHAIGQVRALGCEAMILEVRPSNPRAILMYERRGFEHVGHRPDYYRAEVGREDALVMRLALEPERGD